MIQGAIVLCVVVGLIVLLAIGVDEVLWMMRRRKL